MNYNKETMEQIRHMVVVVSAKKDGNIELSKEAQKRLRKAVKKKSNSK